ncbi:MAG: tetratricopeptide repeat protein [Cyclobacteriaceae bacterium]
MKNLLLLIIGVSICHAAKPQDPIDSVTYYIDKSKANEYVSFDSMFFYANKIKDYGERTSDKLTLGKYHAIVGVALEEMGNYDSALHHQSEALKIGKFVGDSNLVSVSYQHIGVIHKDLGNYDLAIDFILKAVRISDQIGEYYTSAMSNLSLAQIHYALKKHDEAFAHLDQCIRIGIENSDAVVITAGMLERGNNKVATGDLDGGLADFLEVESIKKESGNRDGLAGLISNTGAVYFYKGDFKQAIKKYLQAYDEAEISRDPIMQGVSYQNAGEAYIYLKDYQNAEKYLKAGLEKLQQHGNKDLIIYNYQYLHDLEKARGDYKMALKYFALKDAYEDSVLNERNLANISNLKVQYETEQKEQEIKNLQVATELNALEIVQKRNQIIGLSVLAILSTIGVMLYGSRKGYKLRASLAEEKEQLQKGRFKAVIDAEEKERKRIAQELHDGLGQLLSTARINVSALGDNKDKKVKNSLSMIDQSIDEVRNISHNLMPNALISVGLKPALDALVRKINESGQIAVGFRSDGNLNFHETKTISIYRIVQELVNNALKYSQSTTLDIKIVNKGEDTEFIISDQGEGFELSEIDNSTGIGWSNIYSRVDLMNGKINIYSKLEEGTTVKIHIPNDRESDQAAAG